jgi:hypothetical protein
MRVFSDIIFETREGYRYKVNKTIDLSQVPDDFMAEGEGSEVWMVTKDKTDDNKDAIMILSGTPANFKAYIYIQENAIIEGFDVPAGWIKANIDMATAELIDFSPYDIEKNPLYIDFGMDSISTSHPEINMSIFGEYVGAAQIPKEVYYATINFIFRA